MKITKLQIKKIIQEEIENVLEGVNEQRGSKPRIRSDWKTLKPNHPDRIAYRSALRNWKKGKPTASVKPVAAPKGPVKDAAYHVDKRGVEGPDVRYQRWKSATPGEKDLMYREKRNKQGQVTRLTKTGARFNSDFEPVYKRLKYDPKKHALDENDLEEGELDENAITEETVESYMDRHRTKRQFRKKQGRDYAKLIFNKFTMNKNPDMTEEEFMKLKKKAIGNVDTNFVQNPPSPLKLKSNPGIRYQFEAFKEEYLRLQNDAYVKGLETDPQPGAPDYFPDPDAPDYAKRGLFKHINIKDASRDAEFRRRMELEEMPWYKKSSTDASSSKGKKTTSQTRPTKAKATKSRGPRPSLPSNWKELPINDPSRVAYRNWKKGISAEPEKDFVNMTPEELKAARAKLFTQSQEDRKKFLATATPEQLARDKAALRTARDMQRTAVADLKPKSKKYSLDNFEPGEAETLARNFLDDGVKVPPQIAAAIPPRNKASLGMSKEEPPKALGTVPSTPGMLTKGMQYKLREEKSRIRKLIEEVYDEVLAEEGWFEPHI